MTENTDIINLFFLFCFRRSRRKGSSTKSSEVKKLSAPSFHEYLYMIWIIFFICLFTPYKFNPVWFKIYKILHTMLYVYTS